MQKPLTAPHFPPCPWPLLLNSAFLILNSFRPCPSPSKSSPPNGASIRGTADLSSSPPPPATSAFSPATSPAHPVVAGELRLTNPGPNTALPASHPDAGQPGPDPLAVDNGFARVLGDVVSILTEAAHRRTQD